MQHVQNAGKVVRQAFGILGSDAAIVAYPILVFLVALITLPAINALVLAIFNGFADNAIFAAGEDTAKTLFYYTAIFVTVAYTALIISYFTSIISAAVLARLEGHKAPFLVGLRLVYRHKARIAKFGILSVPLLLIPLGIIVQRKRKKLIPVLGSSISLSMAQLAPAILSDKDGVSYTINHSVDTLGKAWKEGLVLKVGSYLTLIALGFLSFLPKIIENTELSDEATREARWIVSILLFLGLLIVTKVLGAVFTATLYWQVATRRGKDKLIK